MSAPEPFRIVPVYERHRPDRREPVPGCRTLRIWTALVAAGVLLAAILMGATWIWGPRYLYVESRPRQADAIVVLGGESADRVFRAAAEYRHGHAPRVIVSGGGDAGSIMERLVVTGVPRSAITVEWDSESTRENAEFTVRLLRREGIRSIIVVTSWYHSRRAVSCFRYYAPDIKVHSAVAYHGRNMYAPTYIDDVVTVFREFLKIAYYVAFYGILPRGLS